MGLYYGNILGMIVFVNKECGCFGFGYMLGYGYCFGGGGCFV